MKTWDKLIIPKPFARVVVALGVPVYAGTELGNIALERLQDRMEDELNELSRTARQALESR